jgi:predicted ATPase
MGRCAVKLFFSKNTEENPMARMEGFRVQNYRALRDITLGRLSTEQKKEPLSTFTVVIGKNGSGKSTLFDAFGFVSDCLTMDVERACDEKQRGGFDRIRSAGIQEPIRFEIYYRETEDQRPITYEPTINVDEMGCPFVQSEALKQRRKGQKHGRPFPFLKLDHGKGKVWSGEEAVEPDKAKKETAEDSSKEDVELTDLRQLGIATLGTLREHPRIRRFRDFLKGWYLSYFHPDAARSIPAAGPQRHLNIHGDNIGNVVQYMEREHNNKFQSVLDKIARKIPGV